MQKDFEGRNHGRIKAISKYLLEGTNENHKNSVRIGSVLAEIETDHFLNESRMLPLYQPAQLSYSCDANIYILHTATNRITRQYADGNYIVAYSRNNTVFICHLSNTAETRRKCISYYSPLFSFFVSSHAQQ
jgi:hypothetical protein